MIVTAAASQLTLGPRPHPRLGRAIIRGMASERLSVPAVLITGWPASGKSTVGRALASRLGAALIDQDTATAPLVAVVSELVGVSDLDDVRLAGPTRAARYETVIALAEDNLRVGTPVVVVAPFTEERRAPVAWASARRPAAGGRRIPAAGLAATAAQYGRRAASRPWRSARPGQARRSRRLPPDARRSGTGGTAPDRGCRERQ